MSERKAYFEVLPPLSAVYLEDSWVLGIKTDERSVEFRLELVLTPEHPAYHDPLPGERYCYRRAKVTIENPRSVRWVSVDMRPYRDATGEVDYGSIDAWSLEGDVSHIEGDWGELEVAGGNVRVLLAPEEDDGPPDLSEAQCAPSPEP